MDRANGTISFQKVPDFRTLLFTLPGGMNMPVGDEKWKPPVLSEEELVHMRAPPDDDAMEEDSSGDEYGGHNNIQAPAGAFPGSNDDYKPSYF